MFWLILASLLGGLFVITQTITIGVVLIAGVIQLHSSYPDLLFGLLFLLSVTHILSWSVHQPTTTAVVLQFLLSVVTGWCGMETWSRGKRRVRS